MHGGTVVDGAKSATHAPVKRVVSDDDINGVKYVTHAGTVVDGVKSATRTPVKGAKSET